MGAVRLFWSCFVPDPKAATALLAFLLHLQPGIMGETAFKKLNEIRREYMLRVLAEVDGDYKKACAILRVSEKVLRRQVEQLPSKPRSSK
jgi:hypothetical protein